MLRTWVFADGSQAEARVVAWKGPVPLLKEWFTKGEDVHTNVLRLIAAAVQEYSLKLPNDLFARKPWRQYGKEDEERDIAKATVHANNYGMGPEQYAFITKLPESHATQLREIYFQLFPEIKTNYQQGIVDALTNNRTLVNPFGRTRIFYGRIDEKTKREAYAWYASSTVGDWLTDWYTHLCEEGWDVLLQLHDATGSSAGPVHLDWLRVIDFSFLTAAEGDIDALGRSILKFSSRPIMIGGEPLVIPVDFKVGRTWGEVKTWQVGS